jgi:hypothetical protein
MPTYGSRDLLLDAFYEDEWGKLCQSGHDQWMLPCTDGVRRNRFTHYNNKYGPHPMSSFLLLPHSENPLSAFATPPPKFPELIPPTFSQTRNSYKLYLFLPKLLRDKVEQGMQVKETIRLSILFGVSTELNRHGLRAFFDQNSSTALIVVSGREAGWDNVGKAWGIGISPPQIDSLFQEAGAKGALWEVTTLAAFSTGYWGLNGTINNALLPLRKLEKVVIYDCLYRGDEPKPGSNTKRALDALKSQSSGVRLIVYDASPGGTPYLSGTKAPLVDVPREGYILLRGRQDYRVLVVSRALINGVKDKIISVQNMTLNLQKALLNLWPNLPARGSVMSSDETSYLKRTVSPLGTKITLAQWYRSNKLFVDQFNANINEAVKILWANQLLGWGGTGNIGEEIHDCLPGEFAWEFLP